MIIEKSTGFEQLVAESYYKSRLDMAEFRLRADIAKELLAIGVEPTQANVDFAYDGIAQETLHELLAERA